jgi:hypothetical protein
MKPELKMVEIYSGKDEQWRGWHNLILVLSPDNGYPDIGESKSIQGPIDPETSKQLKQALGLKDNDSQPLSA